jgi:hypothetical protein
MRWSKFFVSKGMFSFEAQHCLALCLTGCPSNSKTVQERQALEGELKLRQIVIEAREPTVDDDPIWKTSENALALCNTSSFDHASVDDRAIWDSASSVMRTARYGGRKWRYGVSRRLLSSMMEAQDLSCLTAFTFKYRAVTARRRIAPKKVL